MRNIIITGLLTRFWVDYSSFWEFIESAILDDVRDWVAAGFKVYPYEVSMFL